MTTSSGTTEYRHNILADGQVIAMHTITTTGTEGLASTDYLHYDSLGSVDVITNESGQVVQSMSFDAFGNRRLANNWNYGVSQNTLAMMNDDTNRGYTDQEELDNLSLVDMNGRVYDPTVGRFISADPKVPVPADSQAFNRYSYVYDRPLIYRDPSGYDPGGNIYSEFGVSGPQGVQNLYEMQQAQINPMNTIIESRELVQYWEGAGLVLGGLGALAIPGLEEAGPELIVGGVAEFSAVDVGTAALSSAGVTYALTQGSSDMYNLFTGNTQADVIEQLFGPNVAESTSAVLFAWDWANIVAKPSSIETAANLLIEGLNFLRYSFAKSESPNSSGQHSTARPPEQVGAGSGGRYPGYGGGGGPGMLPPSWEVNPPDSGGVPSYKPPSIQLQPVNVTPSNSNCKPTDPCM